MHHAPPAILQLLAHELRWNIVLLLASGDYRVQEIVARVREPINLVSYHLKRLRDDALVSARRSEASGRDVYYSLDVERLRVLYEDAGHALHPALCQPAATRARLAAARVLIVCTHNSARSQMAEGLLRHHTGGQIAVLSAGSQPTRVHPEAIRAMTEMGIDIRGQQTHHLSDYAGQPFDYVITVCDRVREVCPAFPGGVQLHWGYADPTVVADESARRAAFTDTARRLSVRIQHFVQTLPTT
jgi:protein-tyrosine-phosphatase